MVLYLLALQCAFAVSIRESFDLCQASLIFYLDSSIKKSIQFPESYI